jgi:hypothetical protein
MLFAPVYFPPAVYGRAGFTYSPSIVIDLGGLTANMFAYPRYSHYYFGDYYDDAYVRIGIYPRFEVDRLHTWYDPIYQYDRWDHRRTDPRWEEQDRHQYDLRRADATLRPARTYQEMETRLARSPAPAQKNLRLAEPLTTVVANKTTSLQFEQINAGARQQIAKQATEVHTVREQRSQWESKVADPKKAQLPTERRAAVAPPTERGKQATPPPTEVKTTPVPPREVRASQSDRVKIPAKPVVGKPIAADAARKSPPARPADERKGPAEVKDARQGPGRDKSN